MPLMAWDIVWRSAKTDQENLEPHKACDDDRAVYCSFQKQTSYTFRGYVLLGERDVTKFQGCTRLAV